MTPLPKKKHTHSRTGIRKNSPSGRLLLPNLTVCSSCKKLKEQHKKCPHCGFYSSIRENSELKGQR